MFDVKKYISITKSATGNYFTFIFHFFSFVVIGIFHSCTHGTHLETTSCVGTCKTHSLQTVCHSTLEQWMTTVRCKPTVYPALLSSGGYTRKKRERKKRNHYKFMDTVFRSTYYLLNELLFQFLYSGCQIPRTHAMPTVCAPRLFRSSAMHKLRAIHHCRFWQVHAWHREHNFSKTNKQICFSTLSFIEKPPEIGSW